MFSWKKTTALMGLRYRCRLAGEQFYRFGEDHPWVKPQMTDQMTDEELATAREYVDRLKSDDDKSNYKRRLSSRPS